MIANAIAHYRITAKLGEGGMGAVYRATDTKLNRDVAIKVLPDSFATDPDRLARFTREAQVLASLNHPNVAAIYGVEERAIVLELVEGQTLAGPLSESEALPLIHQLIDALEYAHEKGIVHRDLKPANIKITPEGRLKVLDFGLAKALASEPTTADPASSPTMTMRASMAGVIMGTAGYMSPEQARGQNVDKRADIWAFGVVLYEMLTGRALFQGKTISDTLAAVLTRDPDLGPVPPRFRRLLRLCLMRDPRQRLRDISGARLLLEEAPPAVSAKSSLPWIATATLLALAAVPLAWVHFRESPPEPVPVRFQIQPPEKGDFGGMGMALSPDGRQLAFIAKVGGGAPMLWVRPLDSVTAQSLPGTEGASFLPFWSPDSRSLGFMVQGKLKKIDLSGGRPQTLCEVPGALIGASWGRDGVIIFNTPSGGLLRVSQAGGVPTRLTTLDESHGELGHIRPWFLPDGRHFLYLVRALQARGPAAIYLASLDSKERKRLVSSTQAGAYAPPGRASKNGHLLFLREGTLMALPLEARRLEPAGEPFPVAEQVGSRLAMGFFSVSDNGVLAYRGGGSNSGFQPIWFDREGKPLAHLGPPGIFESLTFSPDAKRVAFTQSDETGNDDIWILDVQRGVPTRFTFDPAPEGNAVWSPDGARLAFYRQTGGYEVYQKDSSGSGNEELLFKAGFFMVPTHWSPDGRYLLCTVENQKTGQDLWLLPVAPGERKPIPYLQGPFNQIHGQFSPDGRWIAYSSNESGSYQVFVQSFPAGRGKFQVSSAGGSQPRWRRDGKEMFYVAADGRIMAVDVKMTPNFEADTPKPLFDPQFPAGGVTDRFYYYDITPDGKRFLAINVSSATLGSVPSPITVVLNWPAAVKR